MFLDSVQAGLKILAYWETYLTAFIYQMITFYILMIIGLVQIKKSEMIADDTIINIIGAIRLMKKGGFVPESVSIGILGLLFIGLLESVAIMIFSLTLTPIILGATGDASWLLPWKMLATDPVFFLFCIATLVIIASIIYIIHLGRIYSLQMFILGCTSVILILSNPDYVNPDLVKGGIDSVKNIDFYPFLYLLGYYVLGVVIFWISMTVISLLTIVFGIAKSSVEEIMLLSPFMPIFQFIPVFMYGAWLGAQIT